MFHVVFLLVLSFNLLEFKSSINVNFTKEEADFVVKTLKHNIETKEVGENSDETTEKESQETHKPFKEMEIKETGIDYADYSFKDDNGRPNDIGLSKHSK